MEVKHLVRKVGLSDSARLWEIRNTPQARKESVNQDEIPWENHQRWFQEKYFSGQNNACFVMEDNGYVIGYCRLDNENDRYVVSIALDPNYHGRGLGTFLLFESLNQLNTDRIILATVKKDNPGSIKIFIKNGFIEKSADEAYLYFEK